MYVLLERDHTCTPIIMCSSEGLRGKAPHSDGPAGQRRKRGIRPTAAVDVRFGGSLDPHAAKNTLADHDVWWRRAVLPCAIAYYDRCENSIVGVNIVSSTFPCELRHGELFSRYRVAVRGAGEPSGIGTARSV